LSFKGVRTAAKANEAIRQRARADLVWHAHILPSASRKKTKTNAEGTVDQVPPTRGTLEPVDTEDQSSEDVRASQWIYAAQAAQPRETNQREPSSAATTVDSRRHRQDVRDFTRTVLRNGFFAD